MPKLEACTVSRGLTVRDADGKQIDLAVCELLVGLICLRCSDGRHLFLSPGEATELSLQLIEVLFEQRQRAASAS